MLFRSDPVGYACRNKAVYEDSRGLLYCESCRNRLAYTGVYEFDFNMDELEKVKPCSFCSIVPRIQFKCEEFNLVHESMRIRCINPCCRIMPSSPWTRNVMCISNADIKDFRFRLIEAWNKLKFEEQGSIDNYDR